MPKNQTRGDTHTLQLSESTWNYLLEAMHELNGLNVKAVAEMIIPVVVPWYLERYRSAFKQQEIADPNNIEMLVKGLPAEKPKAPIKPVSAEVKPGAGLNGGGYSEPLTLK